MNPQSVVASDVSVVVPVYNGESTIAACVESLLEQTRQPAEIVIVDNNSTDRTCEIVRNYPVTLLHEAVQTSYAARNRGIKHARTALIALTDADCRAEPDWVEELTRPFARDEIMAVAGRVADAAPVTRLERMLMSLSPFSDTQPARPPALLTGNVAYRRAVLEALGWFDEALPTGGDVDMGWRLAARWSGAIARAPAAVVRHKHRATWKGLFSQFKRYGYSEILLATLYRDCASDAVSPPEQARRMGRQLKALLTYILSFFWRLIRSPFRHDAGDWLFWPVFMFVIESANLIGKLRGLVHTRWFRRNPYPSRTDIQKARRYEPGACRGG